MSTALFDGLARVDTTGRLILATTGATLVLAIGANLFARARYLALERDLAENAAHGRFDHPVLGALARDATEAARRARDPNLQAIVEHRFESDLRALLFAERFVRAATGLVIILGLLGTFYGLASSIGRLVDLVAGDTSMTGDVAKTMTTGLSSALTGMTVAFSNSLLGIASAVVLTIVGIFSNVSDRRTALMIRVEAWLDRLTSSVGARAAHDDANGVEIAESAERLESAVARFESALQAFASSTRDFTEFNAHLKDNVQRMSLSFGDFSDRLRDQIVTLKRDRDGR